MADIRLESSWKARVGDWFARDDMRALSPSCASARRQAPPSSRPAARSSPAFDATPFDAVKVVILGQDPYHGPGQAHGLCFSVRPGVPVPPSLDKHLQELARDTGFVRPDHGCLLPWARRGVLLLNSVLTVEAASRARTRAVGLGGLHRPRGRRLNREREHLVFLLWGSYAQKKGAVIDARRHRVPKAPHPSPLSATGVPRLRAFSHRQPVLARSGQAPIDWACRRRGLVRYLRRPPTSRSCGPWPTGIGTRQRSTSGTLGTSGGFSSQRRRLLNPST